MEQILIEKMKLSEQLIRNLHGLGFEEIKTLLYRKQISENTFIFRDYRERTPITYAYFKEMRINHKEFKEAQVIEKIEIILDTMNPEKLTAFL